MMFVFPASDSVIEEDRCIKKEFFWEEMKKRKKDKKKFHLVSI